MMPQGLRTALVGTAGLLILISTRVVHSQPDALLGQVKSAAGFGSLGLSSVAEAEDAQCQEVPPYVLSKINLTSEDLSLLPSICWNEDGHLKRQELLSGLGKRSGVPPGVQCDKTSWWVTQPACIIPHCISY